MSTLEYRPWWFVPFLYGAIAVQGALTIHYYRTESIGVATAGALVIVLFILALWGAKNEA